MTEEELKFEDLPKAVNQVLNKLTELEKKVEEIGRIKVAYAQEPDRWMNLKDLCEYLPNHPAEQTIYGWTSLNKIPYHKCGKRVQFRKSEIDAWILEDQGKTEKEIDSDVQQFIKSRKKHKY
ncbi:MAG: helix-turn-helix transcriptional regulator [Phocaeicola sp.]